MAHPPHGAVCQQVGQVSVDRGVGLAENERQLRRVDEGRPAEGVEQLPVIQRHEPRVAKSGRGGQPLRISVPDGRWSARGGGCGRCDATPTLRPGPPLQRLP